jgi:hypothetical protein
MGAQLGDVLYAERVGIGGKITVEEIVNLAGGGTLITGTSILNFGNETDSVTATISNASITNTNIKNISFIPQETIETSLDDFSLNGLTFNIENIVDNTSFDIRATATNNASGNFTVKYLIQI